MLWVKLEVKAFIAICCIVVISVGIGVVLFNVLATQEKLVFGDIEFFEKYDYISVECRNVGTTDIILEDVLLNHRPYYDFREFDFRIPVGESQHIVCEYEWKSEYDYKITVVTNTGKVFSKAGRAPQRHIPLVVEETDWNLTDITISVVVSNIDRREQNISGFGLTDFPPGYTIFKLSEISTSMNVYKDVYNVTSEWDYRITIPAGQTTTIVLDCAYRDSWISGKTYFFLISTQAGPDVSFNSKAP